MVNQSDRQVQKKPLRAFNYGLIFLRIYWVSIYQYFPGFFYCHAGVYQVPLLSRQFVSDPA